ncbi:DUF5718 family protein [Myxococcota bacterium]|nr:DUF5718 family protein [Myxococcota bacterium]
MGSAGQTEFRNGRFNLAETIGLGVAGNFTGHLEQAGEADDFRGIRTTSAEAPKGIFPFYVPGSADHFLHCMPISSTSIVLAPGGEKHQIEPEVALLCDVSYEDGRVISLNPRFAMAHNDCSIRRPGALKISEKKNWGPCSKGTSDRGIAVDQFREGGILDSYRIACFLQRDGELFEYGVESAVTGYRYYGDRLIEWLIDQMNQQSDQGPLENISKWLEVAGYPQHALISIGATRYTPYGEATFLRQGDVASVIVYDAQLHSKETVRDWAAGRQTPRGAGVSLLRQAVE